MHDETILQAVMLRVCHCAQLQFNKKDRLRETVPYKYILQVVWKPTD
jgi:hypothetical protein